MATSLLPEYSGLRLETKRAIIIGIVSCVLVFCLGIVIGYFSNNSSTKSSNEDFQSITAKYQKSCNAKCAQMAKTESSCSPPLPRHYVAHHLNGKTITVDGRLDDDAWKEVPWTQNFMDIRGPQFPAPPVDTKVKIRWDDNLVYVGAYMEEPHVWATYDENDSPIHHENNFEVYFDVDNSLTMYKQVLINALGTTWDLILNRAYMDGGEMADWQGIRQKGVYTDGVVNNASVPATFWSVELSLPFVSLNENTTRTAIKPVDGEWWFMMMARARYQLRALPNGTYQQVPGTDASWIAWNPTGAVNLHLPSEWGMLFFDTDGPSSTKSVVQNKRWLTYQALFDVYNALQTYEIQKGKYTDVLSELDLPPFITTGSCFKSVKINIFNKEGRLDKCEHSVGFRVTIESDCKNEPGVKGYITQDRHVTFTVLNE